MLIAWIPILGNPFGHNPIWTKAAKQATHSPQLDPKQRLMLMALNKFWTIDLGTIQCRKQESPIWKRTQLSNKINVHSSMVLIQFWKIHFGTIQFRREWQSNTCSQLDPKKDLCSWLWANFRKTMLGQSNFEEIHGERNVLNKSVYIPIQTKTYAHGLNPIFEIPDWDNPIAKNRTTIFFKKR